MSRYIKINQRLKPYAPIRKIREVANKNNFRLVELNRDDKEYYIAMLCHNFNSELVEVTPYGKVFLHHVSGYLTFTHDGNVGKDIISQSILLQDLESFLKDEEMVAIFKKNLENYEKVIEVDDEC